MDTTRPLEFRAWHMPSARMCYGVSFDPFNLEMVIYINRKGCSSHVGEDASGENTITRFDSFNRSDCVLMQFTGVLDKKGVKIYEGDILYWSFWDDDKDDKGQGGLVETLSTVIYYGGSFGFNDGTNPLWFEELSNAVDVKAGGNHFKTVTGNIYQTDSMPAKIQSLFHAIA